MKKLYLKRILEFAVFLILCLIFLVITSKLFVPKWITIKDNFEKATVDGLYAENVPLDIIFVGNSDMYHSISPMELWNDYGITSYNYSHPGTRVSIDYYNIMSALEIHEPKYIILGVDSLFEIKPPKKGSLTKVMTSMKFSKAKILATINMDIQSSVVVKTSYIFPIIRFHSRYNELNKDDFLYAFKDLLLPTKGFVMNTEIKPLKNTNYMNRKHKIEQIPEKNKKYLDKIVRLCNENNVELILMQTPSADTWNHKRHDAVNEYAKEKNLKFLDINYNLTEVGIDWDKDTRDRGNHLNIFGALKTTKFVGEYISNNLQLKDHKNDKKYSKWNNEYKEYLIMKEEALEKIQKNTKK